MVDGFGVASGFGFIIYHDANVSNITIQSPVDRHGTIVGNHRRADPRMSPAVKPAKIGGNHGIIVADIAYLTTNWKKATRLDV